MTVCRNMTWILFLSHCRVCASTRTRTDTTLDQDCVLKATVLVFTSCTVCLKAIVQECTACMDASLLTTCVDFNTLPLAQIVPFDARFASQTRKDPQKSNTELVSSANRFLSKQFNVQTQSSPEKSVCSISVILAGHRALDWALKVVRQVVRSVSLREVLFCLLLLLCSLLLQCPCFAHCCHDPIIVRPQSCPPFLGFTQFVHPSRCSRSSLTTVCFCFCFCFLLFLMSPSLYRSSLYTQTATSVCTCLGSLYSYRVCEYTRVHVGSCIRVHLLCTHTGLLGFTLDLHTHCHLHHRLLQPSSCSGVWDPWPCRTPILQFE